jgi:uncharacterized damage-inducible protein DinB
MSMQHPRLEPSAGVLSPRAFLEHWQGHRRLTRRVITAFPDDKLFTFSIGSMRPFGVIALELLAMAEPMVRGLVTDEWEEYSARESLPRPRLLEAWDESTERIEKLWEQLPAERFAETVTAFGQFTGPVYELLLYVIDNEIHHRGQGYVYLRALGIEPPPFWERD